MGYCVSEADISNLPGGDVEMEIRRESVVLTSTIEDGYMEIEKTDLLRLRMLVEYALDRGLDRS